MKDKIDKINKLNDKINELSSLIDLLNLSNTKSEYSTKQEQKINEFCYINFETRVWTGEDTCRYRREIRNTEVMNGIKDTILPYLEEVLKKYKAELDNLII